MDDRRETIDERRETMIYDRLIEFCLIFLIIFTPFAYGAVQPWSIAVFESTAAVMVLLWFFKTLANGRFEVRLNPAVFLFIVFIFYISLQLIFSFIPHPLPAGLRLAESATHEQTGSSLIPRSVYPWATKTELLKVIAYSMIFLVTLNTLRTRRQITRILSIITAVGFLMGVFFLMRYFGADAPRGIINPDHYSCYLGIIIPVILGFLFVGRQTGDVRDTVYAKGLLLLFCTIVMSTALFLTMSRGGMFSLMAALLFMAALVLTRKSLKKRGWILSAVAVLIVLGIAWLGATPVVERLLSTKVEVSSRYFGGRLPIWQGTVDILREYPVLGTGFGTFNYIFPKYQASEIISKHYTNAHSDFLELLSETGIAGFFLFAVCCLWSGIWILRRFCRRHDPYVTGLSIGFFGSLGGIFVHSFTDFNLHIPANAVLTVIILSLSLSLLDYKLDNKLSGNISPSVAKGGVSGRCSLRAVRYALCAVVIVLTVIYIVAAVRPALAEHYFRNTNVRGIRTAIKLDPANAVFHYQLGRSMFRTKYDIRGALEAYKEAVRLNPTNSRYHQSLAWTYGQIADLENLFVRYSLLAAGNAHKHFQAAIRLESNNPYRYRAYAIWLFSHSGEENIEKGISVYRKAIELEPELGEEAFERYYGIAGDYLSLEKIIPDSADGYLALAEYLNKKGLKEKSRQLWKKAVLMLAADLESADTKNKIRIHMKLAEVYRFLGEKDRALKEYQTLLGIEPENFLATYWTGEIYREKGDYELSTVILKKASEMEPRNSWPCFSLARIYQRQGESAKERDMWRVILNMENPDDYTARVARKELEKYEKEYDN